MAKKVKGKLSDKQLASKVMESAQQIWQAGLSAFEQAEKEGGQLFDSLVKEGKKIEARTRKAADATFEEVKNRATGNLDYFEQMFEERVAHTLSSLGIPSKDEIKTLTKRVDELNASLTTLLESNAVAAVKPSRKTAAKKAAAGKASAKRTTSQTTTKRAAGKTAAKPRGKAKDDLTKITGVGPVVEERLNKQGIFTYRQIAAWKSQDIDHIEGLVMSKKFTGRIRRYDWVGQAKEQHFLKYDERI